MKIYYKLYVNDNIITGYESNNIPFKIKDEIVTNKNTIDNGNIKLGITTLNEIEHYVLDENGNCLLYEEETND